MTIKLLKLNKWWTSHFGMMLAFIYLATALSAKPPSLTTFASTLLLFVVATLGIATFGQLMNDLMDIQQDLRSGAPNTMARLGIKQRLLLFGFVILLGLLPWIWLPINSVIIGLLVAEYMLFILYSVPPVRLKARGLWGAAADSLYGYVITNMVAILVFTQLSGSDLPWLTLAASAWMFIFGLGQIIQHQLLDANRDSHDGINTFVVANGWAHSLYILRNVVLPLDCLSFFLLLIYFFIKIPIISLLFLVHAYLLFQWWQSQTYLSLREIYKLSYIGQINLLSNQLLAQFAWHWLSPLALFKLVIYQPSYFPMIFLHFLFFPRPIQMLIGCAPVAVKRILKQA